MAHYSARGPVAKSLLRNGAEPAGVELVANRLEGPYTGVHRLAALEFLARSVDRAVQIGHTRPIRMGILVCHSRPSQRSYTSP